MEENTTSDDSVGCAAIRRDGHRGDDSHVRGGDVGVRGGKPALEQMSAGQSVMAPIARQAIGLHSNAARDEVRVRPGQPNKDVTVNRAFSRRFFEALEADRPDVAQAALHDLEASGPAELLDENDLLVEEDEDEAELDESDLIQT